MDRLVFSLVVLQREGLTRLNVQEFAYVLARVRPDEFVPPGLLYALRTVLQIRLPVGGGAEGRGPNEGERSECTEKMTLTDPSPKVKGRIAGTKGAIVLEGTVSITASSGWTRVRKSRTTAIQREDRCP